MLSPHCPPPQDPRSPETREREELEEAQRGKSRKAGVKPNLEREVERRSRGGRPLERRRNGC